ncbi:MAG: hypothetical protein ACKPKO_41840 [Candidatus Fonsibacter sp.]
MTTFNNSLEKNIQLNIHKIRNHRDNNKKEKIKALIAQAFKFFINIIYIYICI